MNDIQTPDEKQAGQVHNAVFDRRGWLEITLSSIGDGVITTDSEGRVNYLNPVAEKLTGWTIVDAVGKKIELVFHIVNETTGQPVEQPVRNVIQRGVAVGLGNHTLLIARDGSQRPIDDSAVAIRDDDGQVVGVVLIFRDITERRQSERLIVSGTHTHGPAAEYVIAFGGRQSAVDEPFLFPHLVPPRAPYSTPLMGQLTPPRRKTAI
jgi:PAS domain S-box-containing protein